MRQGQPPLLWMCVSWAKSLYRASRQPQATQAWRCYTARQTRYVTIEIVVNTTVNGADAAIAAGASALSTGHAHKAREIFANVIAKGSRDIAAYLGLAYANRMLGDHIGKIRAIDALLAFEPGNIRALMIKADHLAESGNSRAAVSFYVAVTKIAATLPEIPAELAEEIKRAQAACASYASQYASYLEQHLGADGYDRRTSSQRFTQSLDIMLGKSRAYAEQPRFYLFPGLSQAQFHDRSHFPWFSELERATADIRAELLEVMKDESAFSPYVTGDADRAFNSKDSLLNNSAWSAFYLWRNGEEVPKHAARCPKTMQALRSAPLARVPNRSPSILFSLLRPGARIPPHNGLINTRLICHLPLIVPPNCGFRVGSETREWVEGTAWAFNDTIEHEAWNSSDQTRVILLFDIWRPELTDNERELVVSLFSGIDAYSGRKPEWDI